MTFDAPPAAAKPLEFQTQPLSPALGDLAASGFKWTLAFGVLNRVLSFGASIVLARLLLKEDYGAYTQALITVSVVSALRDTALGPVLIARQKEFDRLQSDGFWFSLALGVAAAILIAGVGGVAWHHGDFTVARLLWMNAVASPLMAAGTVPAIKTQIQLRFTLNAKIATTNYFATTLLTIGLAACHWGPYALMVPFVISGVGRAAYFLWLEPPILRRQIHLTTLRRLLIASAVIVYSGLSIQVIGQGDNFVITRFFSKDVVGLYGWAFNLSVQAVVLLAVSLGGVMLPTLAILNDEPLRQMAAFLRTCRTLALIGTPLCALQVIFAQPILKPLFSGEWDGAQSIIRILSVGMVFALINGFCTQLMLARKQNRLLVIWSTACMTAFMLLVYGGVYLNGVRGVACGVTLYHAVIGLVGMRLAVGKHAQWIDLTRVYWPPLLAATVASLPTLTMAWLMPNTYRGNASLMATLLSIALFASLFLTVYAALIRRLAPEPWREVLQRLNSVTQRVGVSLVTA